MVIVKLPGALFFAWDKGNEQKNWLKHKVSAEEAEEPFFTDDYMILEDVQHSRSAEARYILLGKTNKDRMLFMVFTIRAEKIRIISARDANKKEVMFYEEATQRTNV